MQLQWRRTYDVHECPDCGGDHPRQRVWTERRTAFVLCPRTLRRIRIRMHTVASADPPQRRHSA